MCCVISQHGVRRAERCRRTSMIAAKVLAWSVVIAMTAAIIYGFTSGDFGDNGSQIWALPWGKVTLIDLYA